MAPQAATAAAVRYRWSGQIAYAIG